MDDTNVSDDTMVSDTTSDTTNTPVVAQDTSTISTVFVGGLAWATDEASLRAHFENAGLKIAEDETIEDPERGARVRRAVTVARDKFDGRAKGYGFVNLATPEDAAKSIELLHETELDGRTIRVQIKESKPREDRPRSNFSRSGSSDRGGYNRGGDRGGDRGGYNQGGDRGGYNSNRGSNDYSSSNRRDF